MIDLRHLYFRVYYQAHIDTMWVKCYPCRDYEDNKTVKSAVSAINRACKAHREYAPGDYAASPLNASIAAFAQYASLIKDAAKWGDVGIYRRDVLTYEFTPVVESVSFASLFGGTDPTVTTALTVTDVEWASVQLHIDELSAYIQAVADRDKLIACNTKYDHEFGKQWIGGNDGKFIRVDIYPPARPDEPPVPCCNQYHTNDDMLPLPHVYPVTLPPAIDTSIWAGL
jgi:hypothetical protein